MTRHNGNGGWLGRQPVNEVKSVARVWGCVKFSVLVHGPSFRKFPLRFKSNRAPATQESD